MCYNPDRKELQTQKEAHRKHFQQCDAPCEQLYTGSCVERGQTASLLPEVICSLSSDSMHQAGYKEVPVQGRQQHLVHN